MSALIHHPGRDHGRATRLTLLLRSLRTRKVHEAVRALWALAEDGREKLRGEYILDRHYPESLVDGLVDRIAEMVHHACLLAPEGGEGLRDAADRHRARARRLLSPAAADGAGPDGPGAEPEYRLLARILDWVEGDPPGDAESLLHFAATVVDHVSLGPEAVTATPASPPLLLGASSRLPGLLAATRIDRDPKPEAAESEEEDPGEGLRALRVLCRGAGESLTAARDGRWRAEVGEGHFNLRRLAPPLVRVDAYREWGADSDLLFLFAQGEPDLERILPPGFEIVKSPRGVVAWTDGTPEGGIEPTLSRLGRILFSEPAFGPGQGTSRGEDPS